MGSYASGHSAFCLHILGELGHFIDGSEVLAEGSANGFITGQHEYRCVQIHEILACAFHSQHLEKKMKQNL